MKNEKLKNLKVNGRATQKDHRLKISAITVDERGTGKIFKFLLNIFFTTQ